MEYSNDMQCSKLSSTHSQEIQEHCKSVNCSETVENLLCGISEKSQNCVKAAIAFVCTTCKRQLLFEL